MHKSFIKKTATFLATIFASTVLFCACGSGGDTPKKPTLPELIIGVDYYQPFVYLDDEGNFSGIDVDLAVEICRHIGYTPKFVGIDWAEKQYYLARGEIDCVWTCFTITGREDDYSWSLPYMKSRQVVAVQENSDINTIADLKDKRVAVQSTTKPDEIFSGRSGVKDLQIPKLKQLNCFPNMNYTFAAINNGYVDAIAGHEVVLLEYMKTSSVKLKILPEALLEVEVGVAFLKNTHSDIIEKINQTFILLKHNEYLSSLFLSYGLDPEVYLVNYEKR